MPMGTRQNPGKDDETFEEKEKSATNVPTNEESQSVRRFPMSSVSRCDDGDVFVQYSKKTSVSDLEEASKHDQTYAQIFSNLSSAIGTVPGREQDIDILEAEIALEEERYNINKKKLTVMKLKGMRNETHDKSQEFSELKHDYERHDQFKAHENFALSRKPENYECIELEQKISNSSHSVFPRLPKPNLPVYDTVTLPKLEIEAFWGNPGEFIAFQNAFEQHIANKIENEQAKLSYLIYYCKGVAKESIKHCPLMDNDTCYTEAWNILSNTFGRPHLVANAVLKELLGGPTIKNELVPLQRLVRIMRNCQATLSRLGKQCDLDSTSTLLQIVKRLPKPVQIKWAEFVEVSLESNRNPTFDNLLHLVEKRIALLNNEFGQVAYEQTRSYGRDQENRAFRVAASRSEVSAGILCCICSGQHSTESCQEYIDADIEGRQALLRSRRLCFNCLKPFHVAKFCRSSLKCSEVGCGRRHHSLLHVSPENHDEPRQSSTCGATLQKERPFRLGFVPIKVVGPNGIFETYGFIDNGSDTTLVSADLAGKVGIRGTSCTLETQTLHGSKRTICRHATFEIRSLDESSVIQVDSAYIVEKLPVTHAEIVDSQITNCWGHLKEVQFQALHNTEVGVLIGANVPECHWIIEQRLGHRDEPYAVRSVLGWTLRGPADSNRLTHQVNFLSGDSDEIKPLIEKLYDAEFNDVGDPEAILPSVEDEEALKMVENSVQLVDNHYEVPIPWKSPAALLPNNKQMALKRLFNLKNRLDKNESLKMQYRDVMQNHISHGHVRISKRICKRWYLPHHPVLNSRKPGKVRIVFDCAAKSNGVSLNDMLYQGPDLTNNLTGVLLRFRKHTIAFTADIREMFNQVRIPERDGPALSFFWWEDEELAGEPSVFEWRVHPFGAKSSPFCSNFALKRVASDFKNEGEPIVIHALTNSFYVDDFLGSVKSLEDGKTLVNGLKNILKKVGFNLCKWSSNHPAVLTDIPNEDINASMKELTNDNRIQRTLGVQWDTVNDVFAFNITLEKHSCTRRSVLSNLAAVFDPLGFIAPALLSAKILLQQLCRENFGWDTPVPYEMQQHWEKWMKNMELIKSLQIPRCIQPYEEVFAIQLHVFSDASEVGYGAVGYIRFQLTDGNVRCKFLMGKSRVAPLKPMSIPRLELSAALLAAQLMSFLAKELDFQLDSTHLWTDSAVVLRYLSNSTSRFATFVANRIRRIKELSKPTQWRYVPSHQNAADIASRGIIKDIPNELKAWIEGPAFLKAKEENWPIEQDVEGICTEKLEVKRNVMAVSAIKTHDWFQRLCSKAATWSQLLKRVVWITRFKSFLRILYTRQDGTFQTGPITMSEMVQATNDVIRLEQQVHFSQEPQRSKSNSNSTCSRLKRLRPIEINGVLCLGGRLQLSKPVSIIPAKSRVTELIVEHFHKVWGHVGASHVLANIRRQFWVIKGMAAVKRVISRCFECRVELAKQCQQIMAPLPKCRLEPGTYPFKHCGVDYFGPFSVKIGRTHAKRFGCLFTCMQIRAIHIEVANDLSTDSFLMALNRFISRRGSPEKMYSDNGTNFVGAEAELKRLIKGIDQSKIVDGLLVHGVEWNFNPPSASHRGGVWERMIRSVRRVLAHLVCEQTVSEEVLVTALAEAERIINDRPLIPVYDDPQQPSILCPNDLLLLRPNGGLINEDLPLTNRFCRQWRQAQHLANAFWRRWQLEYLPTLQKSQKWLDSQKDLRKGDLVILRKPDSPRGSWQKGVVSEVFPGLDGKVRQVLVKTPKGLLRKDIRSLCLLEGTLT